MLGAGGALGTAGVGGYLWKSGAFAADLVDPHYTGDAKPRLAGAPPSRALPVGFSAVARENARVGTSGFTLMGHRFGDDRQGQIAGYASSASVQIGEELDFHVSVAPAQQYQIQVYRVGHYGGAGARLVATSPWLDGHIQKAPSVQPDTRTVRCDWQPGWRLPVGRDWTSGYYLALLTNAAGWSRWVPFVVRDPDRSVSGLIILPTSTYQAYNMWPRDRHVGASLYYGFDASGRKSSALRAFAVSHSRPFSDNGVPSLAANDIGFVQWLESHGDDVTYATSEDLHTGRVDPRRYWAVVFPGHDEYWSVEMRRSVAAARDHGTSLVFLGANNCYWRIRYGESIDGVGEQTVVCAKEKKPRQGEAVPLTTRWRDAGSPEQELFGSQYVSMVDGYAPLVVRNTGHWFWAGTELREHDQIPKVVWDEVDQVMPKYGVPKALSSTILAASPYTFKGKSHEQQTVLYRFASGAWIFNAGSLGWTSGLYADGIVDTRLQRATRNLLDQVISRST